MTLENAKTTLAKPIITPDNLKTKISLLANCDITVSEIDVFNMGLKALSEFINDNSIDLSNYSKLNVFFTYDGSLSFYEESSENCGSQLYLAMYRMEKLRQLKSVKIMLFVFIEELAHYFLNISDETLIKYKVTEIMQYAFPDFKIEEAKGWKLNGL